MRKIHITRLATAGVAGVLALASTAMAADQKPSTQKVTAKFVTASPAMMEKYTASSAEAQTGMRAYVDPQTRQLRGATQTELNEAAAASAPVAAKRTAKVAVAAAPAALKQANGAKKAVLGESFLSYAVATKGADGKIEEKCIEQQPDAEAALRTATAQQGTARHEK